MAYGEFRDMLLDGLQNVKKTVTNKAFAVALIAGLATFQFWPQMKNVDLSKYNYKNPKQVTEVIITEKKAEEEAIKKMQEFLALSDSLEILIFSQDDKTKEVDSLLKDFQKALSEISVNTKTDNLLKTYNDYRAVNQDVSTIKTLITAADNALKTNDFKYAEEQMQRAIKQMKTPSVKKLKQKIEDFTMTKIANSMKILTTHQTVINNQNLNVISKVQAKDILYLTNFVNYLDGVLKSVDKDISHRQPDFKSKTTSLFNEILTRMTDLAKYDFTKTVKVQDYQHLQDLFENITNDSLNYHFDVYQHVTSFKKFVPQQIEKHAQHYANQHDYNKVVDYMKELIEYKVSNDNSIKAIADDLSNIIIKSPDNPQINQLLKIVKSLDITDQEKLVIYTQSAKAAQTINDSKFPGEKIKILQEINKLAKEKIQKKSLFSFLKK
jgi:hypothetical protein